MKKLLLSLGLIIAFAFYVVFSNSKSVPLNLPSNQTSGTPSQQAQVQERTSAPVSPGGDIGDEDVSVRRPMMGSQSSGSAPSSAGNGVVQMPPKGMMPGGTGSMMGQYRNGSYAGNVVDAYFGNVQAHAIIQGGKIADIQFLQYPKDRQHSLQLSNYAMPILKQEAIHIQNSNVDIVSGATQTSMAFRDSLASALAQAK